MDTFSHALWGAGLFGKKGIFWLALFFGAMPDLLSFGLWMPYFFIENGFTLQKPSMDVIPDWLLFNYNLLHSLLIALSAVSIVYFFNKAIAFAMLAWPFYLLLDIPFHAAEFFPTILFWPVSDMVYDGIAWSTLIVWYANLTGLLILFIWRWKTGFFR